MDRYTSDLDKGSGSLSDESEPFDELPPVPVRPKPSLVRPNKIPLKVAPPPAAPPGMKVANAPTSDSLSTINQYRQLEQSRIEQREQRSGSTPAPVGPIRQAPPSPVSPYMQYMATEALLQTQKKKHDEELGAALELHQQEREDRQTTQNSILDDIERKM